MKRISSNGFTPLCADDARSLIERIRTHINDARKLVLELYEGEGWKPLGYNSWRECVVAEFDHSRQHLYRLLDAAIVERNIAQVVENQQTVSPMGDNPIPERVLRPLAKLAPEQQRETWQTATRLSPKPTAELVAKIVEKAVADAAAKHEKSAHGGLAAVLANLPHADNQPKVRRTKHFDDWLHVVGAIDDLNEIEDFDPTLIAKEEFEHFVRERLETGPRAIERIKLYLAALERRFGNVLP
jgi:hypothetical protein